MLVCTGAVKDKLDAAHIAVSPDGRTVAIAVENNVTLYNGITQEEDQKIAAIFSSMLMNLILEYYFAGHRCFVAATIML